MSTTCRDRRRGFALVSAIFILVVLAALGAAIVTVSTSQHAGSAIDVEGARAYQAARAGVEWGVYQVLTSADVTFRNACRGATYAAPTTQASLGPLAADLSGFGITVTCGSGGAAYTDGSETVWVYQIEATACSPAAAGTACPNIAMVGSTYYIERRIRITVTN